MTARVEEAHTVTFIPAEDFSGWKVQLSARLCGSPGLNFCMFSLVEAFLMLLGCRLRKRFECSRSRLRVRQSRLASLGLVNLGFSGPAHRSLQLSLRELLQKVTCASELRALIGALRLCTLIRSSWLKLSPRLQVAVAVRGNWQQRTAALVQTRVFN